MTDTTTWPLRLQQLAEAVGDTAALQLVAAVGGVRTYVPKEVEADHPLCRLIGREAYGRLVEHYGGEYIEPPRGTGGLKKAAVLACLNAPSRQVALRCGVTQRYVKKLRADLRSGESQEPRQRNLFDRD
ncbi:MAG: hypothetical protein LDL44_19755 [Caenispirillum sp.]|nr:hypothetical protein [Caenispirillum sp.]